MACVLDRTDIQIYQKGGSDERIVHTLFTVTLCLSFVKNVYTLHLFLSDKRHQRSGNLVNFIG